MEDRGRYTQKNTPYCRPIAHRRLVTATYGGDLGDINAMETAFASLNTYARERQLYPVLPMGILNRFAGGRFLRAVYWEISEPLSADERIVELPKGSYRCVQADWQPGEDMEALLHRYFDLCEGDAVLVSNLGQSRLEPETRTFELQLLVGAAAGARQPYAGL